MHAFLTTVLCSVVFISATAHAEDYILTLKNHEFDPKEITIPANQKVKLIIKNTDGTPAEFESADLSREKVVHPHSEASVFVGPVEAGRYSFFDDFHRETTTGTLIAK